MINFLLLFVDFTLFIPAVFVAVSKMLEVPNVAGLLANCAAIASAACQQLVLLHLIHRREEAWRKAVPRLVGLALVLVAMVTLAFASTLRTERASDFSLAQAASRPAYLAVFLLGYAANQINVGILGWKCSKVAPTPWLRRGLLLIAMTLPFAMVYTVCRLADIVAAQLGASGCAWEPVAQVSVTIALIIKTTGWTLPDWGRYLSATWQWMHHLRIQRELAPLHHEVTAIVPAPVLQLDRSADLHTRLYRTVVEIRDAQWALRTWMDPALAATARREAEAAHLEGDDLAAHVEAAQLKSAIAAKAQGVRPVEHTNIPFVAQPPELQDELAFQRKLARAFAEIQYT